MGLLSTNVGQALCEETGPPTETGPSAIDEPEVQEDSEILNGEPPVADEEDTDTWVDATHRAIEESLDAAVLALDRFFATQQYLADTTESFVRVRPVIEYDTDDKSDTDLKFSAKLDLPGTKRRLKLLIDSDSNNATDDSGVDVDDSDGNGAVAIERESKRPRDKWRVRPAVGVKSSLPPDPFVQLRATRYYSLSERWLARLQGTARYLLDDKGDLRAELDLNHQVDPDWIFRARTDVRWRDSKDRTDASQSFTFAQRLTSNQNVAYSLGILGNNEQGWDVERYRYLIVHRQLIYRDWLFLELRPEVSMRNQEDGWEPGGSIQVRLEAFFGHGRLKKIRDRLQP